MRFSLITSAAVLLTCATAGAAEAKRAVCTMTDDGTYPCEFTLTDTDGSFQVTAPGKPTHMLNMDTPGVAWGYDSFGGRDIALPGKFIREPADPACWKNDETQAVVCAR
ncbi:hypothetical protein [Acidisoma cladoniae]|uniref:hypothetical protein n=1 Tax=Acidisoma cladoniae TaxID=3040935 RepID=UPI00254FCD5D|nr:hypothetical protein [Acidisoma sp. PAMC 29798]